YFFRQGSVGHTGANDRMLSVKACVVRNQAKIGNDIGGAAVVSASGTLVERLGNRKIPDPVDVAMVAGFEVRAPYCIVAVQGDVQHAFEEEVLRIARLEVQPDRQVPLLDNGVADKVFVQIGAQFRNRAHELQSEDHHRIVIYVTILVQ